MRFGTKIVPQRSWLTYCDTSAHTHTHTRCIRFMHVTLCVCSRRTTSCASERKAFRSAAGRPHAHNAYDVCMLHYAVVVGGQPTALRNNNRSEAQLLSVMCMHCVCVCVLVIGNRTDSCASERTSFRSAAVISVVYAWCVC